MKNVGANQNPRAGSAHDDCTISAPSAMPLSTSSWIFSSCIRELIAPTSVFLSSGFPTRSVWMRSRSLRITGSTIDSCTKRREPAQQTCP